MSHCEETLNKMVNSYTFTTVLDIGCGHHMKFTNMLQKAGKIVTPNDIQKRREDVLVGNYNDINFKEKFDAIWASHVLEHQPNVQSFLEKISNDCKEGGVLAITVPPLKHEIVGGHVSLWNAGLLLYRFIMAGIDCSQAKVNCYNYNISVITNNNKIKNMPELSYGNGDIELLQDYFPIPVKQNFNGQDIRVNW